MDPTRTAAARLTSAALQRCVGDADRFVGETYGRAPSLHAGGTPYSDLLSMDDVDDLISSSMLRWPACRLVQHNTPIERSEYTRRAMLAGTPLDDVIDPGRVYAYFDAGATIVLQGLQKYWRPLAEFCRDLELALTQPVQCNAYVTPAHSQGLAVHYDTHDVLVLQAGGSKLWKLYEQLVDHPLESQRFQAIQLADGAAVVEPRQIVTLEPGDCLYLPGGYLHEAISTENVSVHLTVGISPFRWSDLVQQVLEEAISDPMFSEPLPIGFAEDPALLVDEVRLRLKLLAWWTETRDAEHLARQAAGAFWSTRPALLEGQLAQLARLAELTLDSLVTRRPRVVARLEVPLPEDQPARLFMSDRRLEFPRNLTPAVEQLLGGEPVRVDDVVGGLDGTDRLELVRRLVREGILEIVRIS